MYRGYKTYRHFLNAKLNALAVQIVGSEDAKDFLRGEVIKILQPGYEGYNLEGSGVTIMTDTEAAKLYRVLIETCKNVKQNLKASRQIAGTDQEMTPGQRKAIIKITKYGFMWSPEATFSFILGVLPEKRKRLSPWEIQNSKLIKLYSILSKKDADRIIKRLDKIKQRNASAAN